MAFNIYMDRASFCILYHETTLFWVDVLVYVELNGNVELFSGLESDIVVTQFPGNILFTLQKETVSNVPNKSYTPL